MSNVDMEDLIDIVVTHLPDVILNIPYSTKPLSAMAPRTSTQPNWCTSQMEYYCLEEGILCLAKQLRHEYLGLDYPQEPGQDNQFVLWQYGWLRAGFLPVWTRSFEIVQIVCRCRCLSPNCFLSHRKVDSKYVSVSKCVFIPYKSAIWQCPIKKCS